MISHPSQYGFPPDPLTELHARWLWGILERERLAGWKPALCAAGGHCWIAEKRIEVPPAAANEPGLWLHEIAHAVRSLPGEFPTGNDKHDGRWGDIFSRLVTDYTGATFKKIGHRQDMPHGD